MMAALAGTAVTRLKLSTSTRVNKILKIFLFIFLSFLAELFY